MPYSREECGDFASVQLRGDKERSIVRLIDSKMVEEKKKISFKIHCFLSIKQTIKKTVRNLYVFVGISNFKIPLCIYYCLLRSLLDIGVRAPSDLQGRCLSCPKKLRNTFRVVDLDGRLTCFSQPLSFSLFLEPFKSTELTKNRSNFIPANSPGFLGSLQVFH